MAETKIVKMCENGTGSFSRISVTENTVELESYLAPTLDNKEHWHTVARHNYQHVMPVRFGNEMYVQAYTSETMDLYNVNRCIKISSFERDAHVVPQQLGNSLFFSVRIGNTSSLYDEIGNLIEYSDEEYLEVCQGLTQPLVRKTNNKTHKVSYWTFEGHLAAMP